jgi:hypothetical protein
MVGGFAHQRALLGARSVDRQTLEDIAFNVCPQDVHKGIRVQETGSPEPHRAVEQTLERTRRPLGLAWYKTVAPEESYRTDPLVRSCSAHE